MESNP